MTEEKQEILINEDNFHEYFFDVRQHDIQPGQIMAKYTAMAEFVKGNEKKNILDLITTTTGKAHAITQVMRKLLFASEADAIRIPRQMAEDMLEGMSYDEVLEKPYKYQIECFFYTKPEYLPLDDPHWCAISIVNIEEHLEKSQSGMQSKLILPEN